MTEKGKIEKYDIIGRVTVSRRGGSLTVTIPANMSRVMDIYEGDMLNVYRNPETGRFYFEKIEGFITASGTKIKMDKGKAKIVDNL
jgi:bifunctional DNA-binding transcriptional regulator/antitoxin component of YhaV-PrlF toxin-antitoxin module